jgi:hypothetical protein
MTYSREAGLCRNERMRPILATCWAAALRIFEVVSLKPKWGKALSGAIQREQEKQEAVTEGDARQGDSESHSLDDMRAAPCSGECSPI